MKIPTAQTIPKEDNEIDAVNLGYWMRNFMIDKKKGI
jgi:hypothetical protein